MTTLVDVLHQEKFLPWFASQLENNLALGCPGSPLIKNPPCRAEDTNSIAGPERSYVPWSSYARALHLLSP